MTDLIHCPTPQNPIPHSGKQARPRARDKRGKVLQWLFQWGVSDHHILGKLLGIQRSSIMRTIASMIQSGYIQRVRVAGMPATGLILTHAGARAVAQLYSQYEDDPYCSMKPIVAASTVRSQSLAHDLLVQEVVLEWMQKFDDIVIYNDREMRFDKWRIGEGNPEDRLTKIPDAYMLIQAGGMQRIICVEIQESYPTRDTAERIFMQYAAVIEAGFVTDVIYASTSPAMLKFHQEILKQKIRKWERVENRDRWVPVRDKSAPMEQATREKFAFVDLSGLARRYYSMVLS